MNGSNVSSCIWEDTPTYGQLGSTLLNIVDEFSYGIKGAQVTGLKFHSFTRFTLFDLVVILALMPIWPLVNIFVKNWIAKVSAKLMIFLLNLFIYFQWLVNYFNVAKGITKRVEDTLYSTIIHSIFNLM